MMYIFSSLKKLAVVALFLIGTVGFATPVQIDFFYELGCHDCERIEEEIFPEIGKRFPDVCVIQRHDIGIETNFITLLQLEDAIGYDDPKRAYLIVNRQVAFGPTPDLEKLCSVISNLVGQGQDGSAGGIAPPVSSELNGREGSPFMVNLHGEPSAPRADPPHAPEYRKRVLQSDSGIIEERFSGFTLPAVIVAGLLDGINPCAISTLVFFMSLLAVAKVQNRQLILLGISFCLASFLTYLALGFGLLRVLHLFSGFRLIRAAIEWGMIAVLLVLAALSLRDALRFRKTHDGHDVTLQLSTGMKKRIHSVMRRGLKTGHLVFGGLFIGTLVTALESVCTGQVYVPTLVLILKDNALAESRAWLYLIAYNLLFILPLILTFVAVYFGLRTETLLSWSRKNVVVSKLLLALLFLALATLILCF